MTNNNKKLIVEGITLEGTAFRPSDWIERLCGSAASFSADRRAAENSRHPPYSGPERRRQHTDLLYPQVIDGAKCLVVDSLLHAVNPSAYRFVMDFISTNRLRTRDGTQTGDNREHS